MATDVVFPDRKPSLLAPADRRPGHRGVRGRFAAAVALLSLVALSTNDWHGHGGGGGEGTSAGAFRFSTDGWRDWAGPVFLVVAGALLVAGAILWKARTRRGVGLGCVVAAAAIAVGVWAADVGQRFATVSAASFSAVRLGTPETVLQGRLGAPFTTDASTTLGASGVTIGCDLYRADGSTGQGGYFFCFRDGVLAVKFTWGSPL